ncbi:uncharacterized protein FYW49_001626 [Xenentodon cancila]
MLKSVNFENPDGNFSTGIGGACPQGMYCPEGTSLPLACPPGTYSDRLIEASDCSPCAAAHYCGTPGLTRPSGPCQAGSYCPGGDTTSTGSEGGLCPPSHYCPEGSARPMPCPAGTYTNLTGQPVCSRCPAGYYCPEKNGDFTKFPCPPGFYCPDGTKHATQFPCPRGYYNPEPMTQSLDSCLPCPPGHYCEKERLTKASGKCKAGWFCVSAAWNSQPFDLDNYTNANCLCPATSTGGRCQVGFFCPLGSSEPIPCPPGTFCNISGLALPVGPCSPGFYCIGGATGSRPTDGETGNVCPPGTYCGYWCPPGQTVATALPCPHGHFCPEGSSAPEPCPSGMYQDRDKQPSCMVCEAGYYCDMRLSQANGSSIRPCPKGHYCPAGTGLSNQHPCPKGSFNPREREGSLAGCIPCPAGHYCPSTGLSEPAGTPAPEACPEGSWSNSSGLHTQEDCKPCLGGSYCDSAGLSKPSGLCKEGYYCLEGAITSTPTDGITGGPCPVGHHCPEGTVQPVPCDPGTYVAVTHATQCFYCPEGTGFDLKSCPEGTYGPDPGTIAIHVSQVTIVKLKGFQHLQVNAGKVSSAKRVQIVLILLTETAVVDHAQKADCIECPAGFFCPGSVDADIEHLSGTHTPMLCPEGHYCPPAGTFSKQMGLSNESDCELCPPGRYCSSSGLAAPAGLCSPGYLCIHGSVSAQPDEGPTGGRCSAGSYCPQGTSYMVPCPPGTFSPMDGAVSIDACQPCLPGHYCAEVGLSSPSGPCSPGFYCTEGSRTATPLGNVMGTFLGSSAAESEDDCEACYPGFYCPLWAQMSVDLLCPPGWFCPTRSVSGYQPGFYCMEGSSVPSPCPVGHVSPLAGKASLADCSLCPSGSFCNSSALTEPSGLCSPGHFCTLGSTKPSPVSQPYGDVCPLGHFCPQGSGSPKACPVGSFLPEPGAISLSHCRPCPPGKYCRYAGAGQPSGLCDEGFFCSGGADSPTPRANASSVICLLEILGLSSMTTDTSLWVHNTSCSNHYGIFKPPGQSMSHWTLLPSRDSPSSAVPPWNPKKEVPDRLLVFPAAINPDRARAAVRHALLVFIVKTKGQAFLFSVREDFIAPVDLGINTPVHQGRMETCRDWNRSSNARRVILALSDVSGGICPVGHFCAEGSSSPSPCPAGFYQNEAGGKSEEECKPCPLGWFQDLPGQKECNPCPAGFHCQPPSPGSTRGSSPGISSPLPCPAGYICPGKNLDSQLVPCPKGTYSPKQGLITTGDCAAGFYCNWGSSKADPAPCPAGFFCPTGTPFPVPCPTGTFSSVVGNIHRDNCTICIPGYYCQDEGSLQPAPCPAGHYCPAGVILGSEFPCPPGTLQGQLGASSFDACLPCPPGKFCSQSGLSRPTGLCQAGYFCPEGSVSPNSTEYQVLCLLSDSSVEPGNSSRSNLCPSGHYCPSGSGSPLPCPAGSLATSQGLKRLEECPPCPAGLYCDSPATADISEALPCQAGYVCLGGSSSPAPSDGFHGYPCPAGYSCPVGSASEVPCEPGTYSPGPGAGHCVVCQKGTMCPSSATQEPSICPLGHFCPAATALPQACPLGTLNNQTGANSVSACTPCPPGVYCSTYGASTPQGPCWQGYFCEGGAADPTPESSASFPRNGPCPAGHFCPAGCISPVPCPLGSIRNTTGGVSMESCFTCPAGHYCSTEGLTNPSGPCAAGFYCPFDFSSTTPYAFLCPKGHFCPEGSALAFPCPTGAYQPNPGEENCIPCQPGFYCEEAIVGDPWPCPPHSFCPAGTMMPQACPNGTYTRSDQGGLQDERECFPCPPGKFCRAGKIQGFCAAGYLCISGSGDFTPQGSVSNFTFCQWGVQCAGPCPPGFYCPEGTQQPQMCPANTVRSSPGGVSLEDCLPCPPQYWCKLGDPVLHLCPAGHYCDGLPGSDFSGGTGPRPCPLYTYQGFPGAGSKGDCLACPPGSHCNSTGLTDYSSSPCPPGFWCSGSGPPVFCPAGTSRQLPGAASPSQCEPCAAGTFCPDPRLTGKPNLEGIPCRASYQCPVGAVLEKLCRAGSYCGPQTAEPRVCPEGYLCPEGSHSYKDPKQLCLFPYYCPANSSALTSCEGGSMPVNTSGLRGSKNRCCRLCEGGTFRTYLSPILQCLPCPAGYYCPPGTDNYKNKSCPLGYICPLGSTQPMSCPPGSFGNLTHAEKTEDCHPCPVNTFNHLPAQKACFPCGSSSKSPAGSSSCTCIGKNRAFHYSDGSCLCRTGFIFYNELDFKSSTSDSGLDCQPEVNRRCATGEVRLAASRECVSPSQHLCNITCGTHGGTLDVEMGICHCNQYVSAEELCNASCLSRLPQLSAQLTPDGELLFSLKERGSVVWAGSVTDVLGPDIHARISGKTHLVQFDSEGVFGWIPAQKDLISRFLSVEIVNTRSRNKRDAKEDDGFPTVLPRIPNPIVCLSSGDMLIFHITINHTDRQVSHFPKYNKDHLFNSNPSWDFGAFRHLEILVKQTHFNSTRFAHVFSETGKYVFVDSAVPERSMVVVVSEEGTECDPRAAVFQPMTPGHLVRFGIVKQHRLNLLPDWGLIVGILSLLLVVVVVLTITVIVVQPDKAKLVPQWRSKPKWRSLGEPFCPVECVCSKESIGIQSQDRVLGGRGVGEGAEVEEPAVSKGGFVSESCELEEFNVKTLYDKLEDQNLHIASQLARHRKDTQEFYRNICQHTESLKDAIANMDGKKLSLLKEILVRSVMKDKLSHSSVVEGDSQAGTYISLLGAVLRSAEALLCRLTGEAWQSLDLPGVPYCHTGPHDTRDCDPQAGYMQPSETDMCLTQFSSLTMNKPEALSHETDHEQHMAPCVSDHDLSKLVMMSPLYKTLQELQQSLQNLTTEKPHQDLHNCMESPTQNVILR